MEDKNSASAQKAERCSVEKFRSYLISKQETLPLEQLLTLASQQQAEKLKFHNYMMKFFVEIRKPNGGKYKLGGLQCIRYGLNRYTVKYGLDYIGDPYFEKVTKLWDNVTSQLDAEGLSEVSHHEPLSENDLRLAYRWCNSDPEDPERLQKRVFIDLVMALGHIKKCNLAELTYAHFTVRKIDNVRHIYMNRKRGLKGDTKSFECILSENPSLLYCPVKPFLKYLSKLDPKAQRFFCKVIPPNERRSPSVWYYEHRVGSTKIGEFMKDISNRAGLSRAYTNHCLRVTNLPIFNDNDLNNNGSASPSTSAAVLPEVVVPKVENELIKIEKIFDIIDLLDDDSSNNSDTINTEHFVGGNGPTRDHPDPLPVRPMNMLQSTAGYAEAGPSNQGYTGKPETSRRKKIATATVSSETVLIPDDSPPQPTAPKLQKKQLDDRRFDERRFEEQQRFQERRFENRRFDERRQQMAAAVQSAQVAAPSLQIPPQMQVKQHLQVAPAPPPLQIPRQVQVLAPPPVQVPVPKPKPVEKPRPREKRIFVVADHQRCVMSNLASLWKSGKLCDAGIGNGSSTVMVHKVVLSAVCPKLLSVFSTDILSHKFLQVNFPEEVSTEALNAFAEYMYNGILDLDPDILQQLKIIAKRLDMKEFEQLCDSHLPNQHHQPVAATSSVSFNNLPLIQTSVPIIPSIPTSHQTSLSSLNISTSSLPSVPSITTQVIDVKQEISEAELDQVKKDTAAVFGEESQVVSLAPNQSGNAGFVISPSIKTEPIGPEDDKYGRLGAAGKTNSSCNQVYTSSSSISAVPSSSSSLSTATFVPPSSSSLTSSSILSSIPTSSTEYAIPFTDTIDIKTTELKLTPTTATTTYETPSLMPDLSSVTSIVEAVCSQPSAMNEDSTKPLTQQQSSLSAMSSSSSALEGPSLSSSGHDNIYPVGLFTAEGDNLPLLTTQTVGIKTIDLYKTDLT